MVMNNKILQVYHINRYEFLKTQEMTAFASGNQKIMTLRGTYQRLWVGVSFVKNFIGSYCFA